MLGFFLPPFLLNLKPITFSLQWMIKKLYKKFGLTKLHIGQFHKGPSVGLLNLYLVNPSKSKGDYRC